MPEHLDFLLRTVLNPGPPVDIRCSCDDFWSVAQQRAMERLYPRAPCPQPGFLDLRRQPPRIFPRFIPRYSLALVGTLPPFATAVLTHEVVQRLNQACFYAIRARRVAAAYASVFLEDFEHGNPARLGRFYWAGLAAFASKQVACALDQPALAQGAPDTVIALAKGNLWLYNDAWPWHFAWALCPKSVHMCMDQRNATRLHPVVRTSLCNQEWASEVLPRVPWHIDENTGQVGESIGQLQVAPLMRAAIKLWDDEANSSDSTEQSSQRLEHLRAMARHEQGEVLQGLIYADDKFVADLEQSRFLRENLPGADRMLMFKLQLSFSAEEYADDPRWRSDAPPGIRLQDYKERMSWIDNAALRYHQLMNSECRARLLEQLRALANQDT